jgi:hypothetical protein
MICICQEGHCDDACESCEFTNWQCPYNESSEEVNDVRGT